MTLTRELYIWCGIMFILGQAVHLSLIKIPSIRKRTKAANKLWVFKEWWDSDWNIILGTGALGAMVAIGLPEILNWKPEILSVVRWFFAAVGAFGSQVAMSKFSQYEKNLTSLLDIKSNIADEVTHANTQNASEAIVKGIEATGKDITKPTT